MARWLAVSLTVVAALFLMNSIEAQSVGKGRLDVDAVFKKLDVNNDGRLVRDEFLRLADRFKDRQKARDKLTATYNSIDPTNVGLTKDQFRKYLDAIRRKDEASR